MKNLALASTFLVGLSAAAVAADMPYRAAPAPVYAPVGYSWTGAYIGLNGGYAFENNDRDNRFSNSTLFVPAGAVSPGFSVTSPTGVVVAPFAPFFSAGGVASTVPLGNNAGFNNNNNRDRGGFVGGGQFGINYQLTPGTGVVFGVETDFQYADLGSRRNRNNNFNTFGNSFAFGAPITGSVPTVSAFPVTGAGAGGTLNLFDPRGQSEVGIDYFGTFRGRLGYAWDRLLVYGTGGVAYGAGRTTGDNGGNGLGTGFGFGGGNCAASNSCGTSLRFGYTGGAGLEYAFTDNFSAKIEGLYVNLRRRDRNYDDFATVGSIPFAQDNVGNVYRAPATAFSVNGFNRRDDDFFVVRAGLNYKFTAFNAPAAAPVVARY